MIRREIHILDRKPQWLLISQVEHARISALFAKSCASQFSETIRSELLQAVEHHDDGWLTWEQQPQCDDEGRPLSFHELPLTMTLPIWSRSIQSAEHYGPFVAATVASHFLALLRRSDKSMPACAKVWEQEITDQRHNWLIAWQALNPVQHVPALADEALGWLQFLDVLSLWLCGSCPGEQEEIAVSSSYHYGGALKADFYTEAASVDVEPWYFDQPMFSIEAHGWLVPIQKYGSTKELLARRTPHTVKWRVSNIKWQ